MGGTHVSQKNYRLWLLSSSIGNFGSGLAGFWEGSRQVAGDRSRKVPGRVSGRFQGVLSDLMRTSYWFLIFSATGILLNFWKPEVFSKAFQHRVWCLHLMPGQFRSGLKPGRSFFGFRFQRRHIRIPQVGDKDSMPTVSSFKWVSAVWISLLTAAWNGAIWSCLVPQYNPFLVRSEVHLSFCTCSKPPHSSRNSIQHGWISHGLGYCCVSLMSDLVWSYTCPFKLLKVGLPNVTPIGA